MIQSDTQLEVPMDSFRRPLQTFLVLLVFIILVSSCDNTINLPNDTPTDGITMYWQGELESYPMNPQEGYAFYNTLEKTSYIYANGKWDTLAIGGSGLVWLGEYSAYPSSPQNGDAFYHTLLGNSYVYNGSSWELLARRGSDGQNGLFDWIGSFPVPPEDPEDGWAYHNDTDGISYIFTNGEWKIFSYDGQSLIWLGELPEAPSSPSVNMAYFNTTDNVSYIWNGSAWSILTGNSDVFYTVPIIWKGNFSSAPNNPDIGWMYYNSSFGKTFVWSGSAWEVVASDGISPIGFLIQWKGSFTIAPSNPQTGWAYHNTNDNCTYLYDGTRWCLMLQGENILSSISKAKLQVKVDGEIVYPGRTISFNEGDPDLSRSRIVELKNIGTETLFFSDYSPVINNPYTDIVNFDLTNYKNELTPGESFTIDLDYQAGQLFIVSITLYNSSLDSPWSITFYNTVTNTSTTRYLYLNSYYYPFPDYNSYYSYTHSVFYVPETSYANPTSLKLDFGKINISAGNTPQYRIHISSNLENDIHLPGNPAIRITGEDATSFQIEMVSNTNITIPPSASIDLFTIKFTPTSSGDKTATLHIPTDIESIGEIQYQLVGTATDDNWNLFTENGFAPITFENDYCEVITQDGNGGLYLISESYYKNSKYFYEIIHMDSSGNTVDRFSIETESANPKYAEYSSNTLKVYSGSNRYTINTTTHSSTKTSYAYTIGTPQIDSQSFWRLLAYNGYRFGLTSYSSGLLTIYNNENEKLATYYGKFPSSLADACISDRYLYTATGSRTSIIRRIDLEELIDEMISQFF